MLAIQPARRLRVDDVLASPWFTEKVQPVDCMSYDEGPRYRGQADTVYRGMGGTEGMDAQAAMAAFGDATLSYGQPVYRGGVPATPPGLMKQEAMFCAEMHVAEEK